MVGGGCGVSRLLFALSFVWFGVIVLVLTVFYCLIGAPDFPWLWCLGFYGCRCCFVLVGVGSCCWG